MASAITPASESRRSLILHEDEHLLVVDKPPGINTHSATPFSGEGIYEWLRRREPTLASLAILHRLDKDTSGVMVFSKSRRGNVSLNKQFGRRRLSKEYVFRTDRPPSRDAWTERSFIRKGAGRFESRSESDGLDGGLEAETRFEILERNTDGWTVRACPLTGRTHQIRLHAAGAGIPILGDTLYGGTPHPRLCLHARSLCLRHPATNAEVEFRSEPEFATPAWRALREAFVEPLVTTAFRQFHGAADGVSGAYVDRLGDYWLLSTEEESDLERARAEWVPIAERLGMKAIYLRRLERRIRGVQPSDACPVRVWGADAPETFEISENGLRFELSFREGYSVGLFLDQRDNRRRLIRNWIGPEFPVRDGGLGGGTVLNAFAYTCGFSVAAAVAGAVVTSVDLSKKYLDWGRRNFLANQLDPERHDFIYGDAFEWMRRLAKKGRRYDTVVVDPPTFSQSRERGVFRAESDYAELVSLAASLVEPGGVLLASTNAARIAPETWVAQVDAGVVAAGRAVEKRLFVPQPPDFPTCRDEPGYLKTCWTRLK